MSALVWTRPWGFAAWLLPIAVVLLARRAQRARIVATGTLEIWERVAAELASTGRRARGRLSLAAWAAIAALVLGALALSGPSPARASPARTWHAYLDRRPGIFLPDGDATRIQRAVALARAWLDDEARSRDVIEWNALVGPGNVTSSGRAPPDDWLRAPRVPLPAPDWLALDHDDALWITDRAPDVAPVRAGVVLSGGRAAPGPIGASGTTRLDWDGERVTEVARGVPARHVRIDRTGLADPTGSALAAPIDRVLRIWADARGLAIGDRASSDPALIVTAEPASDARAAPLARDGWFSRGAVSRARTSDGDGELRTWLAAETDAPGAERRAAITCGPGRIDVAIASMQDPSGDPAAFAVSMAQLFDTCVLPPPGVVALAARAPAGAPSVRPPRASEASASRVEWRWRGAPLDAWLALAALVLALLAIASATASLRPLRAGRRAAAADRVHQSA
jgi:hypothetical protein